MSIEGAYEPAAPKRTRRWIAIAAAVILLVGGGTTAAVLLSTSSKGPTYPKSWDPRIAPLAAIAAKDRGLTFLHPVFVEFLSNKAFNKAVTTDDDDVTPADKTSEEESEAIGRAFGYFSGSVDLVKQSNQLDSAGILAFYSPADKKIRVRGTKLTPAIKVTLVHELTHVLQDQHFDLSSTEQRLADSATEDGWAYHAVVEGDARRIETEYRTSLPKAVQQQLAKADDAQTEKLQKQTKDVPDFLIADQQAPYDLGQVAVTRAAVGGNKAVDKLFTTPPTHEIELMQPWLLGTTWTDHTFTMPTLDKGDTKISSSEFGAYYLYLLLAERLPVQKALAIADGWGGDSSLEYTHDKTTCAKIALTGQNSSDTGKIYSGLRVWAAGIGKTAQVSRSGSTVNVVTCDPGKKFKAGTPHSLDAEQFLTFRNSFEAETEKQGATTAESVCYADGVANYLGAGALTLQSLSTEQRQRLIAIAQSCR